jgi:hypothetical protein
VPMPAAPIVGRKNCTRCTRWRHVIDFPPGRTKRRDGTPIDPPQLSSWCEVCHRKAGRVRAARSYARRKAALQARSRRNHNRVLAGEALWAGPFAVWLERAAERHGWPLLAEWAECEKRRLTQVREQEVVDFDLVDRLLLREGSTHLDELYPLGDRHAGVELVAA